ncbi:hypothetical protein [Ponticoccus alexandrii]|uniref:Response regulatory domain-containing protein n=1 Tax=Ponticoccus alexandrii TaxID=1943633 RepID=A0ABX7FC28_9RHOB|nr:hypothetical protein [Ponticoccus alexandrii]ETA51119.1 hypothetical protein P279_15795 [Rhodobacteraceae bacterium PD-2]QRF67933.1 hypothetical protein GQA70_17460 [Ponticoccus alexandrii]
MLRLLIVEPDPLISLDLAEAASHRMSNATVEEVPSVAHARARLASGEALTHMFIRKPDEMQATETYGFISEMSRAGVISVLVGADEPPRGLPPIPHMTHLSIPFTSDMLESVFNMRFR